jgi:hypothetical protein
VPVQSQIGLDLRWVWAFNGHTLRTIRRFPNDDATTVIAEPW